MSLGAFHNAPAPEKRCLMMTGKTLKITWIYCRVTKKNRKGNKNNPKQLILLFNYFFEPDSYFGEGTDSWILDAYATKSDKLTSFVIAGSSFVFLTCLMWQSSTKAEVVTQKLCVSCHYVRKCSLTFILNCNPEVKILETGWEGNRKALMWWEMAEQTLQLSSYQSQIQPQNAVKK